MGLTGDAPVLAFLHADGTPLLFGELDPEYLRNVGMGPSMWERPVRVALEPQTSKRGNTFFSYEQSALPLPAGLDSEFTVNGARLTGGEVSTSKRGNPTRRYDGLLSISEQRYATTGYVTKTKSGFWVKFHLQVARGNRANAGADGPVGGSYV